MVSNSFTKLVNENMLLCTQAVKQKDIKLIQNDVLIVVHMSFRIFSQNQCLQDYELICKAALQFLMYFYIKK